METFIFDDTINIEELPKLKRASGVVRHGAIHISVPKFWSRKEKSEAIDYLKRVLLKKAHKERQQFHKLDRWLSTPEGQQGLITLDTQAALERYVRRLNSETLRVPLAKVRIGQARFSRLAQMNIETRTMTVSKFCLKGVPEPALRYLLVHELAHLIEANHSKRFWKLVAQFVPDYKQQSDMMKAFHKRAVDLDVLLENNASLVDNATPVTPKKPVDLLEPDETYKQPKFTFSSAPVKQPRRVTRQPQRMTNLPEPEQKLKVKIAAMPGSKNQNENREESNGFFANLPSHLKRWWQLKLF